MTSLRHHAILAISCLFALNLNAQDCLKPQDRTILHGNNIRTFTHTGGDLFWDRRKAHFKVPFEDESSPSTIFASGLWLGGYDASGSLKHASSTFPYGSSFDYAAGPLIDGTTDPDNCEKWDKHWVVFRNDLLQHIEDALDGVIDTPNENIFGWPGRGNVFFEEHNGFTLPDDPQLSAPFYDLNNDDIYQPDQGEYPLPENIAPGALPSQISWCVFNDGGVEHTASRGEPLNFEIQLTSYAFSCDDQPILNNTIFTSYKLVNRSGGLLDSTFIGIWSDPDLGCYTDDLVGCNPDLDAFYAYNVDPVDGTSGTDTSCSSFDGEIRGYKDNPPVQSMAFLNRRMHAFMATGSEGVPIGAMHPETPSEAYRILSGRFRDGTPVTTGEDGYLGEGDITSFMFHDNPTSPSGWSMYQVNLPQSDRRVVASVYFESFAPNQSEVIDVAWAFHQDPDLNNVTTTLLMEEELETLKSIYTTGFADACSFDQVPCMADCVWPGDANRDGIVNYTDYLTILTNLQEDGIQRLGPTSWQPFNADDWNTATFYGINSKHCDANGDGDISNRDLSIVDLHFGQARIAAGLQEPRFGNNVTLTTTNNVIDAGNPIGSARVDVWLTPQFDAEITGFTFEIRVDPKYFGPLIPIQNEYTSPFRDSNTIFRANSSDTTLSIMDALSNGASSRIYSRKLFSLRILHNGPDLMNTRDTTYVEVVNARAVQPDGKIISIPGQRLPLIFVDEAPPAQIQNEKTTFDDVRIFPNPTTGILNIAVDDHFVGTQYQVYDTTGKLVHAGLLSDHQNQLSLKTGLYFVHIRAGDKVIVERVLVF